MTPDDVLEGTPALLDWRRRVADLYAEVRADADPRSAWERWRRTRDELISSHPQSPVAPAARAAFAGATYFDYDPRYRVTASLEGAELVDIEIARNRFTRFAFAVFELEGRRLRLDCYWLEGYAGGLFLPFGDTTNGAATYGGGRYLLDTAKGADLGGSERELVLDFNFAYNPSCAYEPAWACPLAPAANRLPIAVEAGERAH